MMSPLSLRKDRGDTMNIKIIHWNCPTVICEDGFHLNVRMTSRRNILTTYRFVGLEPSQSHLILLVTGIEVDVCQVPRP